VPIYQGDYWLRRLRIANEEHTKHTVACDTMKIYMQQQTTGMPYLLKDNNAYNKLHDPEWVKT